MRLNKFDSTLNFGSIWVFCWQRNYYFYKRLAFGCHSVPVELWTSSWSTKRILFLCNNQPTVHVIKKGRSKCPQLMLLLHTITWYSSISNFIELSMCQEKLMILPMPCLVFRCRHSTRWHQEQSHN